MVEGDPDPNWSAVYGPIWTTIANLQGIGWLCPSLDWWCDSYCQVWTFDSARIHEGLSALSDTLRGSCADRLDRQACLHRNGEGIQHGIDMHVLSSHLKKLSRASDHRLSLLRPQGFGPTPGSTK